MKRLWLLLLLFIFCPSLRAQSVELACPSGTFPIQSLNTIDSGTGKIRQNLCMDTAGNLYFTASGGLTAGPLNCKTFENIACVDQANTQGWAGSDYGAWIMSAISSLSVVNGFKSGKILLAPSTSLVTQSSGVTISSPFITVEGPGPGALQINCTFNGNCWDVHVNPFVIDPGTVLKGFSIVGQGAANANAVGFHIGDVIGGKFEDLAADNFRGANSACFWFDNVNGWTERNWFHALNAGLAQATQQGCTKVFRFTNTAGTVAASSFGHNHFVANKFSVAAGQTGISIESGTIYDGKFEFTGNAITGTTATILAISGLSFSGGGGTQLDAEISVPVECTAPCSAGTLLNVGAGTSVTVRSGMGFWDSSALLSSTVTGSYTRQLNSGLNNATASESLQIHGSPGSGTSNSYFITPQNPGGTRPITLSDPGGADTFAWLNAAQTFTNKTINVPFPSGTGFQIFNTTTTCTTAASVGATCTTPAISLPVAEADANYRVSCTGKGITNVPVIVATTNSSATQFTITIAALTAAAASFTSYDCMAGHN